MITVRRKNKIKVFGISVTSFFLFFLRVAHLDNSDYLVDYLLD